MTRLIRLLKITSIVAAAVASWAGLSTIAAVIYDYGGMGDGEIWATWSLLVAFSSLTLLGVCLFGLALGEYDDGSV